MIFIRSEEIGFGMAKSLRKQPDGKVIVTDGPYIEAKEHIGGFSIIEAADMDEAVKVAARIPPAQAGTIEVRPIRELTSTSGQRRQV